LLACAAGCVDAVSYIALGRVFTANMTGNTVLLGLAIGQAESQAVVRSGLALLGFLVGVALGASIAGRRQHDGVWPSAVTAALALEWVILLGCVVVWQLAGDGISNSRAEAALIVLSALAMGIQTAAARRLDASGIATTYITGTLTRLVTGLVDRARGVGPVPSRSNLEGAANTVPASESPSHAGLLAAVWFVYVGGAAVAAAATFLGQLLAFVLPIAVISVVITIAAVCFRQGRNIPCL